uniref:Cyclic nucleotide-gated cation channel beta-1 n=1 Tax=Cacopsylla melanoneura TaxID=428564 RepID=A0A8D9BSQ5_9HEMI
MDSINYISSKKHIIYPSNAETVESNNTWLRKESIPEQEDSELCEDYECSDYQFSTELPVSQKSSDSSSVRGDIESGVDEDEEFTDSEKERRERFIQERIRHIASVFTERAQKIKRILDFPPTPSSSPTLSSSTEDVPKRETKVAEAQSMKHIPLVQWVSQELMHSTASIRYKVSDQFNFVIEPQSYWYISWLCLVTLSYLYNCWVIPLRVTFPYQDSNNLITWLVIDYVMDAIYILDLLLIKPRLIYLDDGFWIRDSKLTSIQYKLKLQYKMDLLALMPFDLLYFVFGLEMTFLRLPRLIKIQTFWEFCNHFDSVLASPYVVRVARTLTYMLYLIHLNACAYYTISAKEGLNINSWVYDGKGNAYIRCFYFATKTATSIGKNPRPTNEMEYVFMTVSWLLGVFVFAVLIGQIRDIIATATKSQTEYRKLMDETLDYLRRLNVPPRIRERVKQWFSFTWEQQHTLDENRILNNLPLKLKTDVAINVHIQTLSKVQLFQDCDEALLRELVLKLRPVLYLPGDYICRKGEVGKEMYIVKTGQVQVVSGETVLATLTEGSVFGEISLLALAGTNRRTADVRSHGFSNLFVLNKDDLNEAIEYYPNAQEVLKKKARQLIKENAAREGTREAKLSCMDRSEALLEKKEETVKLAPRLLPIVMQVVPQNSMASKLLRCGSKSISKRPHRKVNRSSSADTYFIPNQQRRLLLKQPPLNSNSFECQVTVHREDNMNEINITSE